MSIRRDQPLPRLSNSAQQKHAAGQISECCETMPELWLSDIGRLRGATLYEQYFDQANGYRISMLTFDGALDDEDDPDEEGELEERWTPRFRR